MRVQERLLLEEKMFLTRTGRQMLRDYCRDMLGAPVGSDPVEQVSEGNLTKYLSGEIIDTIYGYLGVHGVCWGVMSDLITATDDRVRLAQRRYYKVFNVVE
jgi:hypothetical protein